MGFVFILLGIVQNLLSFVNCGQEVNNCNIYCLSVDQRVWERSVDRFTEYTAVVDEET